MSEVTLFAGPSAVGLDASLLDEGDRMLPPVRRGDVDRLVAEEQPAVLVVCDGIFHSAPAVSHAELCRALDAGWQVWGVSSIGAIRAHELRDEGMHGFGWVYSRFSKVADFTDDEMCLLHFPEPPYFALSEPLVNLRFALDRAPGARSLANECRGRLLHSLRKLWFGDRTRERIRDTMLGEAGFPVAIAEEVLACLAASPIKTVDLARLMQLRPWLN